MKLKKQILLTLNSLPIVFSISCSINEKKLSDDKEINKTPSDKTKEENIDSKNTDSNSTPVSNLENTKKEEDNNLNPTIENPKNENENELHDSKEIKEELFNFPTIIEPENLSISHNGNIYNPKKIFDLDKFPKNIVLEDISTNKQIVSSYFNSEMKKVYSTILGANEFFDSIPKWFNFYDQNYQQLAKKDLYKKIPDMHVWFKNNDQYTKLVKKNIIDYVQDNELILDNNILSIEKNISDFILSSFKNRTLSLYALVKNNFSSSILEIKVNIEELLNNKIQEWKNSNLNFLEYKISLSDDNKIKFEFRLKNGLFSFDHNEINSKYVFEKYNTLFDIMYEVEKDNDKHISFSNKKYLKNDLHAKLTTNEILYSSENKELIANNGRRILSEENNKMFNEIRKRVFTIGGGTSTMISKVKPSDENNYLYYFITNRHVSDILESRWNDHRVIKKVIIPDLDDSKIRNYDNDISLDVDKNWLTINFWQAINQNRRDGTLNNSNINLNNADISINIINIKPIIDKAKLENNLKILNYFENWKNLKPLKLSKKIKYLDSGNLVNFYLSSFPTDPYAGFTGKRYREHIVNRIEDIIMNDQPQGFEKYGYFKSFKMQDDLSLNSRYDLISVGSGSLVFDENMDMIGLFMQNIGDNEYGFGLFSSFDYDYFGYENDKNLNSFKKFLQNKVNSEPEKFDLIEF
ncbi:Uncharacterised protein [Mycoplasmopsis maculosa]|uniref:Lipoprotein n=1 Tax=Mycoplasmopsis maculosa TaxID=114885 RepID=A0A449B447_9BACT|nr:hypothetical protein [Mycoplasmopsis maculosa]VEU75349.1 Uncharacterised protein [Mycoplasmopsis maculosa]